MEKNSVKNRAVLESRLAKLRQAYDWIKAELDALEEKYREYKQKGLTAEEEKNIAKLASSARKNCDKTIYANLVAQQKLKEFDLKQYLAYRKANHGCAKKIFEAIKQGQPWQSATEALGLEVARLQALRLEFVERLENRKERFLQKNPPKDAEAHEALKVKQSEEFAQKTAKNNAYFDKKQTEERQKLTKKLQEVEEKITQVKQELTAKRNMDEDVLLRVEGLKMYFGGIKAVDDLTFDVKKGEIFGLIGPNGAGKTTVFNCITRFYDATAGNMYFENKYGEVVDLRSFKVHDVILQGITRTFQNIELVKEISVIENLLVACTRNYRSDLLTQALALPKLKKEEKILRAKALKVLKFMGLDGYADWIAMGLPYGILKKVEIARALMSDAKLIIMDEPAAGLNDTETAELTGLICKIRDQFDVTILLVEHDMKLVMSVCDTVCAISFGKMLAIGTTQEVQNNPAVQEAYLGSKEDE